MKIFYTVILLPYILFPLIAQSSPPTFTSDWFSANIKNWDKNKVLLKDIPNKRCLEIGAYEGRSTIYIVENYCNGKGSTIDVLDTWKGSLKEYSEKENEGIYERFMKNLSPYMKDNRITINKGKSIDTLLRFVQEVRAGQREKYDFVYIDGSHVAKDVLIDTVLSWELLKNGGLMYFDDYQYAAGTKAAPSRPEAAIDGFLECYDGTYKILHKGYQVHLQKTMDSTGDN